MFGDFSKQADAYQRSRPDYPAEMVDQLLSDARVTAGDVVADIGAGTGIFTRLLVERGLQVTAVEPNKGMQQHADTLSKDARWVTGSFEDTTLADASQRWVVAAQAFHWADSQRSLPEIRRILAAEGAFTVVWNNRSTVDSSVLKWVRDAISRSVPEFDHNYRNQDWTATLLSTGDFYSVVHRSMRHNYAMSAAQFVDLWRSQNRLNTLAGNQRMNALLTEITQYLQRLDISEIIVPYVCEAWTIR